MAKPAIIFLPGFMCDERLFEPQSIALQNAGYNCHYGDQTTGTSMEHIARSILQSAPTSFAAVGLSMGGLVALEIYKQAPERISHLALLNTTARADAAGDARKAQIKRVAEGQLDLVLREDLKPQYLHPDNRTQERLRLLENMGQRLGENVFYNQTAALAGRPAYFEVLSKITCPTLVLCGANDHVCPIDRHEEIARYIGHAASLVVLPTCGHISTLEQPQRVTQAIRQLLEHKPSHNSTPIKRT